MTAPIQPAAPTAETTQAIVEQPVPAGRVVHDYGMSWLLYLLAAGVFLLVLYRMMRRWPKWLLVPIWSAAAAGALTPASSTPEGPWLAPAAIVGILGFDQDGITGLMRGAVPILLSFVAITALFSLLLFVLSRRPKPAAAPQAAEEPSDAAEVERHEPKL